MQFNLFKSKQSHKSRPIPYVVDLRSHISANHKSGLKNTNGSAPFRINNIGCELLEYVFEWYYLFVSIQISKTCYLFTTKLKVFVSKFNETFLEWTLIKNSHKIQGFRVKSKLIKKDSFLRIPSLHFILLGIMVN